MSTEASQPTGSQGSPASSAITETGPSTRRPVVLLRGVVLGLALLSGLAAWLIGERTFQYARLSKAAAENYQDTARLNAEMPGVLIANGALTFGALGALLGAAMGLAGGLCGGPRGRPFAGALAGLALGAIAGALPSAPVMPWYWKHHGEDPATLNLLRPLLVHLGLWSGAGLAAGLAFGLGRGPSRPGWLVQAALAGLVGAMVGTFAFEMVGAILFPMDFTADPFSVTPVSRLLARLCVTLFVGVALIRVLPSGAKEGTPDRDLA